MIYDAESGELLHDLSEVGMRVLLAQGGNGGLGNIHFKSSTNRTPRQYTAGTDGERFALRLELKVLADVGLLGMPNAGKSTLITAVSNAKPKIADYPFTTLHPNLGVVRTGPERSFVIADIPGVIEGAAEGAGLGHRFLKHLARTRVLLHLVDLAPMHEGTDIVYEARAIVEELKKYDPELTDKPRWLVLNKLDLIAEDERAERVKEFLDAYGWEGRVFEISGATREGCEPLMNAIQNFVDAIKLEEKIAKEEQAVLDEAQRILDAKIAYDKHQEQVEQSAQRAAARTARIEAQRLADAEAREDDA